MNTATEPRHFFEALKSSNHVDVASGTIRKVSLISLGEARGHKDEKGRKVFVDETTLEQVFAFCRQEGTIKVKTDHGSGVLSTIGYLDSFSQEPTRVVGNLHIYDAEPDAPRIFEIAAKNPTHLGISLEFTGLDEVDDRRCLARCDEVITAALVSDAAANKSLYTRKDLGTWDESKHNRDDDGKFGGGGGKADSGSDRDSGDKKNISGKSTSSSSTSLPAVKEAEQHEIAAYAASKAASAAATAATDAVYEARKTGNSKAVKEAEQHEIAAYAASKAASAAATAATDAVYEARKTSGGEGSLPKKLPYHFKFDTSKDSTQSKTPMPKATHKLSTDQEPEKKDLETPEPEKKEPTLGEVHSMLSSHMKDFEEFKSKFEDPNKVGDEGSTPKATSPDTEPQVAGDNDVPVKKDFADDADKEKESDEKKFERAAELGAEKAIKAFAARFGTKIPAAGAPASHKEPTVKTFAVLVDEAAKEFSGDKDKAMLHCLKKYPTEYAASRPVAAKK